MPPKEKTDELYKELNDWKRKVDELPFYFNSLFDEKYKEFLERVDEFDRETHRFLIIQRKEHVLRSQHPTRRNVRMNTRIDSSSSDSSSSKRRRSVNLDLSSSDSSSSDSSSSDSSSSKRQRSVNLDSSSSDSSSSKRRVSLSNQKTKVIAQLNGMRPKFSTLIGHIQSDVDMAKKTRDELDALLKKYRENKNYSIEEIQRHIRNFESDYKKLNRNYELPLPLGSRFGGTKTQKNKKLK
jgi:hypothetical protein